MRGKGSASHMLYLRHGEPLRLGYMEHSALSLHKAPIDKIGALPW